jgi:hypothetical protein
MVHPKEEHGAPHAPTKKVGQMDAPHDVQGGRRGHDGSSRSCWGGRYGRTPHNCRGCTPRVKPGKNGHTAGISRSGGHAPQNGVTRQDMETTQHQRRPDRGKRVAPHNAPEQEQGCRLPVQGEPKSHGAEGL